MKKLTHMIVVFLGAWPSYAQKPTLPPTPTPALATSNPSGQITNPGPVTAAAEREKIQEITHRIQLLELQMARRSDSGSGWIVTLITAIIGAAAVYAAAKLGIRSQLVAAEKAASLAGDEAIYRSAQQFIEFRIRQIQEFYGPMFALLRQSKDLYDKMLEQLVQDSPTRYRKIPNPVGRDFRWEVLDKQQKWQGFRLLDQFPDVKKYPNTLAVADAMLRIGEKICKVISTRAGYASEDLVEMLGQYMAHFAILSAVRHGPETEPFEPGWHKVGYYPFGLDTKIGEVYKEMSRSIDEYGKACTRKLEVVVR